MTRHIARVVDSAHEGVGMVKVDEKVYFVDGVLPGELIEFAAHQKRRGKFSGTLTQVLEASAQRVTPRCEYFGVCGGCIKQHIATEAQIAFKETMIFNQLARHAEIPPPETRLPPLVATPWGYRRKARLGVRFVENKGGILVGFRERTYHYLTSLQHCQILDPRLSALLPSLHQTLGQMSCRRSIPQLEAAAGDNAVALVLRHLGELTESDLALLRGFAQAHGVQWFLQPGGLATVQPLPPAAPESLYYRLDDYDLTLQFAPTDFIQVNAEVNAQMVRQALALLAAAPGEVVVDLFCGVGNFTLPLARSGAQVVGIEGTQALCERASANATRNGLGNVEFQHLDLYAGDLPLPASLQHGVDKMLLDPPRSGAAGVVAQLVPQLRPRVIVYISCNPATFVRDAAALVHQHGYRLSHAGAVDMFPHTAQVEAMGRFVLPD